MGASLCLSHLPPATMVKLCSVFGCSNNKARRSELSFYMYPNQATEPERRERWLVAVRRCRPGTSGKLWRPASDYNYVCSEHFIGGRKSNKKTHPDYVPSVFKHKPASEEKKKAKLKRTERLDRREEVKNRCPRREQLEPYQIVHEQCLADETMRDELPMTPPNTPPKDPSLPDRSSSLPVTPNEREMLYAEIDNLRRERDEANRRAERPTDYFSEATIAKDKAACTHLIGISYVVFIQLFTYLSSFLNSSSQTKRSLTLKEQLLITLVKLRQNISFDILAGAKGIPESTCRSYFHKWVDLMYSKITFFVRWQDRETIFQTIPADQKAKFPRLTSIIDCFEIFIDYPKNLKARSECYSNYKKHATVKVFISCSPRGSINFVSTAWGGRVSDVEIVRKSGFISSDYHLPGDQILADRGFLLQDDLAATCGAHLIIPAFTKRRKQLSAAEIETTRKIASVRIHIERVIGYLKNRYTILKGPIQISLVKRLTEQAFEKEIASIDKIVTVCAALLNMTESIVSKE